MLTVPQSRSPSGVVGSAAAGVLGFVLVAIWGVQLTPLPEDFPVSVKLEYLEQHAEDFDAIFIGSSNVFRSFVPNVVDARLAELGTPLRTFNLGGPGMYSFESDYMLHRVLAIYASKRVPLRYIFIEPGNWEAESETEPALANMLSNRSVFFHDLKQTWNVLRSITRLDQPLQHRVDLALSHLGACIRKLSSYGQGQRMFESVLGLPQPQSITLRRVESGRGYQALEEIPGYVSRRRRALLLEDLPGFYEKIRIAVEQNVAALDLDAFCRVAIKAQQAAIRAAGVEVVYVLPPATLRMHHALRLRDEGVIRLIAFNDPEQFPLFYLPENHFDPNHLDRAAAVRFSQLFATELSRLLAAGS